MKTIFGTGAFGEPYRVDINDDTLYEAHVAQQFLRKLPWDGEFRIPAFSKRLGHDWSWDDVEIIVCKNFVWLSVDGPESRENIIDIDLFKTDNIYLSNSFEYSLPEFMFSLTPRDMDLIEIFKRRKENIIEK